MIKSNKELIEWLRANSSGVYRPSAEGADRLEFALYIIRSIKTSLPQKRDWLDPQIEKYMDNLIKLDNTSNGK